MPTTRTSRPARFKTMIRRVRLEKMVKSMNRLSAMINLPKGMRANRQPRRLCLSARRGAALNAEGDLPSSGSMLATALLLLLEAIADAVERFDHFKIIVGRLELLA